jgi:hypothetical protein
MKRTAEFVLGLLGGIFGFGGAFFALVFGAFDKAFNGSSDVSSLGWSAFLASVVAIIGSVVVRSKAKVGGVMMLIAAVWGVISISMFYVVPFALLVIAGLMGVFRKDKQPQVNAEG